MPFLDALNHAVSGSSEKLRLLSNGNQFAIPIFSFGNPDGAKIASISLNPSGQEFKSYAKEILTRERQRFENPWIDAVPCNRDSLHAIQADGHRYFQRLDRSGARTFYRGWFGVMEALLNASRWQHSYLNGTACHLDLSPWASEPVWGELLNDEKIEHLKVGLPILLRQLGFSGGVDTPRTSSIGKILLNGRTTATEVFKALAVEPTYTCRRTETLVSTTGNNRTLNVDTGTILGIEFVAWNIPLDKPFGRLAIPHIAPYL